MLLTEDEFQIDQIYKGAVHRGGAQHVFWSFTFAGMEIEVSSKCLLSQRRFRLAVFRATGLMPPRRAPVNYDMWLDNLVRRSQPKKQTADPAE